jgi:hypothetical protein
MSETGEPLLHCKANMPALYMDVMELPYSPSVVITLSGLQGSTLHSIYCGLHEIRLSFSSFPTTFAYICPWSAS